jgi:ADP-heptose:LPS heptosyltransferase
MDKKNLPPCKNKPVVLCSGGIGDALMTLPMIRHVTSLFGSCDVIIDNAAANEILLCAGIQQDSIRCLRAGNRIKQNLSLARFLYKQRYTHSYQNHVATAGLKYLYLPWMLGIKRRHGGRYSENWKEMMLTYSYEREPEDLQPHKVVWNLRCIPSEFDTEIGSYRVETFVRVQKIKGRVGIHPGTDNVFLESLRRRWPAENFAELARMLLEHGIAKEVLVFIGPSEKDLEPAFLASGLKIIKGKSLREVFNLIASCRLFVSNDSGLSHLAYSSGLLPYVLYGTTDSHHAGPLERIPIVSARKDLRSIPVDVVFKAIYDHESKNEFA